MILMLAAPLVTAVEVNRNEINKNDDENVETYHHNSGDEITIAFAFIRGKYTSIERWPFEYEELRVHCNPGDIKVLGYGINERTGRRGVFYEKNFTLIDIIRFAGFCRIGRIVGLIFIGVGR